MHVTTLSAQQLSLISGVPECEVAELVEYGALVPIIPDAAHWMFSSRYARTLLRAVRLRRDLLLEFDAFALAVGLIAEITAMEDQIQLSRGRPAPHCGQQ